MANTALCDRKLEGLQYEKSEMLEEGAWTEVDAAKGWLQLEVHFVT